MDRCLPSQTVMANERLRPSELSDAWAVLSDPERSEGLGLLGTKACDFFLALSQHDQASLIRRAEDTERRLWMRVLPPEAAANLLQAVPPHERTELLKLLDESSQHEVTALLAYDEDVAGGLMSPRFARLRPSMSVDEAVRYLRRQAHARLATIYYGYVLDPDQQLVGVVSFRDLFVASEDARIADVMRRPVITVRDDLDQEAVARVIAEHGLHAVPVLDADGRMRGVITIDDLVDVVQREATEDMHKVGGMEALDSPYLATTPLAMVKQRAGWLAALFLGEMLTASAMSHFEAEIARAVVLALFVPLIISSGGNSGSQATTLVIRALALGELKQQDWRLILRRELIAGGALGVILGSIGLVRKGRSHLRQGAHRAV